MRQQYITATFSPMMLGEGCTANVRGMNIHPRDVPLAAESAVGHEATANVLSALCLRKVGFNRVNLVLKPGDTVWAVIPGFRASEAREFTRSEVEEAGWRVFRVDIGPYHTSKEEPWGDGGYGGLCANDRD